MCVFCGDVGGKVKGDGQVQRKGVGSINKGEKEGVVQSPDHILTDNRSRTESISF